jgi:hypothetical protein
MGEFVENRESDLPYDESIWFALVEIKDSKLVNRSYNSTAGNVGLILNILMDLKAGRRTGQLLGVWNGERKTNLFLIDPEKMIPIFKLRLKRLETMTFKDVKELEWRERYKVKS